MDDGSQYIPESLAEGSGIIRFNVPAFIKEIKASAFAGSSLKYVDLGSVTKIHANAFASAPLDTIVALGVTIPTLDSTAFSEQTYNNALLVVNKGAESLFRNAPGWRNFKHIRENDFINPALGTVFFNNGVYYKRINDSEVMVCKVPKDAIQPSGSVHIPDSIETIPGYFCKVTTHEYSAFGNCSIDSLWMPATIKNMNGIWLNGTKYLNIPAMSQCGEITALGLETLILGDSVKSIGEISSTKLRTLHIPPLVKDVRCLSLNDSLYRITGGDGLTVMPQISYDTDLTSVRKILSP